MRVVPAPDLTAELASDGEGCRIRCAGELDIATADILRNVLASVDTDVVVDFAAVTFADSSGIAVLIAAQERLDKSGHRLRLDGLHGGPRRAIEILGLLDVFT